jgi:hypothetical protein
VELHEGWLSFPYTFTQEAAGTLQVEISSQTDFSRYGMGSASLDGTLEIVLQNNYEPNIGDTFLVIDDFAVASFTGQFAAVTGQSIGNGKRFEVVYALDGVMLEVVAE